MNIDSKIRGKITEFSDDSRKRLMRKLDEFSLATSKGRLMAVTLTTGLTDAKEAKHKLKQWSDNMRHVHQFAAVYSVEFNRVGGVHFHMSLRYFGDMTTEELRRDCFRRWRRYNPAFCPDAGSFKPVGDVDGWNHYIAKRDEQKSLRGPVGGDGLGGTWWGVMGRKLFRGLGGEVVPFVGPENDKEQGDDASKAA